MSRPRFLLVLMFLISSLAQAEPRALLQLVDYVGVDYPGAVQDGVVVNPEEYAEMLEFSARIGNELDALAQTASVPAQLTALAKTLVSEIENKGNPLVVADTTAQIRHLMMANFDLELVPRLVPNIETGAALYQQHCAACHGATGRGDGPVAASLAPAPTDFHDAARARERSVFGLYNTITLGVNGTAMTGFDALSDQARWSLAFYVGGLFATDNAFADQRATLQQTLTLTQAVTMTPAEIARQFDGGEALAVHARHDPQALFASAPAPLDVARSGMLESADLYQQGNVDGAKKRAVQAYLEGFELVEAPLKNMSPTMMHSIESAMIEYRSLLNGETPVEDVQARAKQIVVLLDDAQAVLNGESLSPSVAFTSSLIILLREGLEALLVVAAMAAFLVKTERYDAMRWLHGGWILALIAGGATWAVSNWLFAISGATREITEGVTALVAAAILFYVGFWMHSRANAQKWNEYIKSQMNSALGKGALWSFAVVSFLAVYREIFETILFYQALWVQVDDGARHAVLLGGMSAVGVLVVVAVMIHRFGLRLPLAKFFTITAYLMIAFAFVFAGKGVAALQEAGRLPMDPVSFPRIDFLGVYPSVQGLSLQALVLILAATVMFWQSRKVGN